MVICGQSIQEDFTSGVGVGKQWQWDIEVSPRLRRFLTTRRMCTGKQLGGNASSNKTLQMRTGEAILIVDF